MITIEKKMIGAMLVCIIGMFVGCNGMVNEIEKAGGMKSIIVEAGKEIKDIGEEIAKD